LVFLAGARAARKLGLGERRRAMRGDRDRAVGQNGHSFHAVRPDAFNYVWDNNIKPALEVDSGEVVEFTVRDASDEQIKVNSTFEDVAKLDFEHVNPVSGPVYVKGARPGDVLAIEILEFRPRDWGWTALIPGFGLLADEFPEPWLRISRVEATRGRVVFAEGIELPYEPFPGTIGVAPAEPGPHSIVPPSRWGGNMDTKHLRAGTTLYLPVGVEGALFSVGDTHSAQGDGEVCGTAIETAMEVSLRLSVRRDFRIDAPQYRVPPGALPRVEGTGFHVSTGVASDLMEATRGAVRATMEQLVDRHGLSREEAYALCTRWWTLPTGWLALFCPTTSLLEEVLDDHGSRADPRAGPTPRAALLGGGRAVDRDHGPGSGHGPEWHAAS
jgi:acetamidase/formamidase